MYPKQEVVYSTLRCNTERLRQRIFQGSSMDTLEGCKYDCWISKIFRRSAECAYSSSGMSGISCGVRRNKSGEGGIRLEFYITYLSR
jgi:hypothetical protein